MAKSIHWWARKTHRWGAILIAVPLLIVILSGLLLQVKKQVAWVQPQTKTGSTSSLNLPWESILEISSAIPEAAIKDWNDIDRLDVRPSKGMIKVRCENGWELQLDAATGEVLSSAYRRSDIIESIHDGTFFSDAAKLWVFLPNGILLLGLWFTGVYLWWLPISIKKQKRRRTEQ